MIGMAVTWSPHLQPREANVPRKLAGRPSGVFPRMVFLGEITEVHTWASTLLVKYLHVINMPGVICSCGMAWKLIELKKAARKTGFPAQELSEDDQAGWG